MRPVSTFLLACTISLLGSKAAVAQNSNVQTRDVNAAGPFPIYLAVQGAKSKSFQDFRDVSRIFRDPEKGIKTLWGGEAALGVAINEQKLSNFYVEAGYRNLLRITSRTTANTKLKLLYKNESISGRVGMRINLYYPITLHAFAGGIFYRQLTTRWTAQPVRPGVDTVRTRRYVFSDAFRTKNLKFHLPGWEFKIRLNVLDPIGSSGGLGVYGEFYHVIYSRRFPGVDRTLPGEKDRDPVSSDNVATSVAVGVIVPLALRFREFPVQPRRWIRRIIKKE